ncbi:cob(I)alamin adenosyltransferase [Candidatus Nanopelagicus hibericus]|jgi:cob(I)alamin adenosyltransferase|uniref:Corrinoid adenosyltransferase n=1 Tax=Candidatus Nanopelagicus hibericus TaxID=1884915 RepID=A0A249KA09_9ACTN|nr:cob(I)yrinic acid a,c-diamide adenosyltransferase [Candidatus Nanopelagicus hibericus]ASY13633.1 cob(I)alamin adenosyltransferase [Candidatus Nanopelagicus hibericus]KGA04223.1 MAG: cob(I)yrinic acid a,c-diamide adenosyltransferase [actinobacterium acIB-AMD-6]
MVNLTRIYTKTGDDGTTSLGDMSRTSKNDPRLEAYATVDEANSSIGVVLAMGNLKDEEIKKLLIRVQNDLFDVGGDLCTPVVDKPEHEPLRVLESQVDYLEKQIDKFNENLTPLRSFVLPSGTPAAALMHVARTVTRRAERATWHAIHSFGSGVNPVTAKYLNRLSDLLFVLARYVNKEIGDQLWVPGANR